MDDGRDEVVRIDATGTAHPVGRTASQRLRARQGAFRLMPAPAHLVVMRYTGEDGRRDPEDGPVFRLAGEITAPGALCDIVSLVGQASWTGELVVLDGATSRSVFFDHGHVVAASSSVEEERLGQVLYRYGALDEAQVARVASAVTRDLRFGEAAIKLGLLTRETLFQLVGRQVEEIVFAVLLVGDGMFYFLDQLDESRLPARLNMTVSALLMEGVRRMDEMRYFRERIPSDQHVPVRVEGRAPPDDHLASIHAAADGQRSLAEICRVVAQGEFEVTQGVFQLLQAGAIVIHAPRATGPEAVIALFNQAMTTIFRELDPLGKGDAVRDQLASFATGAGIYDTLFRGGGPAPDGSLDAARVADNAVAIVGPGESDAMLSQWLHEYVSFALFVVEAQLRGTSAEAGAAPLTRRVAELVAPLAP